MKDCILVIADDYDLHVDRVVLKAEERRHSVFRIDPRCCLQQGTFQIFSSVSNEGQIHWLRYGERILRLDQVTGVLCRSWDFASEPSGAGLDEVVGYQERVAALKGFFMLIPEELWLNYPFREDQITSKLVQSAQAVEVGLMVPNLCITNSPEELPTFLGETHAPLVIKQISDCSFSSIESYEGSDFGFYTEAFRSEVLADSYYSLEAAPVQLQVQVEGKVDLRITVVGQEIFPVRLDVLRGAGEIDIRKSTEQSDSHHPVPHNVAKGILGLMHLWGLKFCAFDFLLDEKGNYWFLEGNPSGNWGWMDSVENSITEAVVRFLIGKKRQE